MITKWNKSLVCKKHINSMEVLRLVSLVSKMGFLTFKKSGSPRYVFSHEIETLTLSSQEF